MPRRRRTGTAGIPHHVLNRASRRDRLFVYSEDYRVFVQVLAEAKQRLNMRLLAFSVMPNHWHLIVWPSADKQLSQFMHWLTLTHTQRWHTMHATSGTGPLYQGRYKAIPIQSDHHFLTVARYVERNPVRAGLVDRVQDWPWCSAWHRSNNCNMDLLDTWPVEASSDWLSVVNEPQNQVHLSAVREAIGRSAPFGDAGWTQDIAEALDLAHTLQRPGRPCKK